MSSFATPSRDSARTRRSSWVDLLVSALAPHRIAIVLSLLLLVVRSAPYWVIPYVTAVVIDVVASRGPESEIIIAIAIGLGVLAAAAPAHLIYVRLYSRAYRSAASELRRRVTMHLQAMTIGAHARRSASAVQTKIIRDVENIELLFQQSLPAVAVATNLLAGALVITALQVPAFLVVFAVLVPLAVFLIRRMRARLDAKNAGFRREVERLSAVVGDMAHLTVVTRAHGLEDVAIRRVMSVTDDVKTAGIGLDRLNGALEITWHVALNGIALVATGAAAIAAATGILSVSAGQVVLLSSFCGQITAAVLLVVGLTPVIAKGAESAKSLVEILRDPDVEANEGKRPVQEYHGHVSMEGVGFRYPAADRWAVRDVSFQMAPGTVTALVGSSGSGKSTLLNLALGFIRPDAGHVLFDGADMADLDMRTLRQFFSVVPQDPVLVNGSIRDNVAYGLEGVDDARLRNALDVANAWEFVRDLPDGWDSPVGERGVSLSGGQRQRLAIARAVIRDPRLLLLDEATSALDSESETRIRDALAHLMRGRTSLVIAHRLSTIRAADQIVVLEHGVMREVGTHEHLLTQAGRYAELHRAQAG